MRTEFAAKEVKITILSDGLGYSRDYVGRMMKPGSNPGITDVLRVCEAAGISFVYVFTGKRNDPAYDGVISEMSKLSQEELTALKGHLQENSLTPVAGSKTGKR